MPISKLIRLDVETRELYNFYHIKKLSFGDIGKYYNVQSHTISRWIKMLGFPLRLSKWYMFGNTLRKGKAPWCKGKHLSEATKRKLAKTWKGKKLSPEHRAKVIRTLKNGNECKAEKNPSWKGGISSLENLCKRYLYRTWIYPIMQRDGFRCRDCGAKANLCVHHHKRSFADIRDKVLHDNPNLDCRVHGDKLKIIEKMIKEHTLGDGVTLCQLCLCKKHGRDVTAGRLEIAFGVV